MSKLVSDLFDISELAHHGPENIFISLLKILGSFALLLWINVPMTLILAAVTLTCALLHRPKQKDARGLYGQPPENRGVTHGPGQPAGSAL